jgi:hypothetical protein
MKIIVNSTIREIRIKPGHKCYKLKVVDDKLEVSIVTEIEHADGLYCSALNLENAIKKFTKMISHAESKEV